MRILCIGDVQLAPALRAIGHEIRILGGPDKQMGLKEDSRIFFNPPSEARQLVKASVDSFRPEAIFVGDDSSPLLHLGLEHYELPRLWWSIDTHLHARWHQHFAAQFHRVMGAQRPFLKKIRDGENRPAKWMPLFFPEPIPFTPWDQRTEGVTFVGTLDKTKNPRRVAFFEALQKRIPVRVVQGNYRKVYCQSQIVVNQAVAGDLNNRIFEAMGCGAALVTEALPQGFRDIGEPGQDFLTYTRDDVEAAAQIIESLWADPKRCEAMARRGYDQVQSKHLASHRANLVDSLLRETQERTTSASRQARDRLVYAHLLISRLSYPEPLQQFFVSEAKRRAEVLLKRDDDAYPWAHLLLAELHVGAGRWKKAGELLKAVDPPDDADYLEVFAPMRAVISAQATDPVEALYWIRRGLRLVPESPILLDMAEKLKLG